TAVVTFQAVSVDSSGGAIPTLSNYLVVPYTGWASVYAYLGVDVSGGSGWAANIETDNGSAGASGGNVAQYYPAAVTGVLCVSCMRVFNANYRIRCTVVNNTGSAHNVLSSSALALAMLGTT